MSMKGIGLIRQDRDIGEPLRSDIEPAVSISHGVSQIMCNILPRENKKKYCKIVLFSSSKYKVK